MNSRPRRLLAAGLLFFSACAAAHAADENDTPGDRLVSAARNGKIDGMKAALAAGAKITFKNKYGETALMNAADNDQPEAVQFLLAQGAKPLETNPSGRTALTFALMCASDASAVQLIRACTDSKLLQAPTDPADIYLNLAAYCSARDSMLELLKRGVPPDPENEAGRTPLSIYAEYDDPALVEMLLHYHADPNSKDHQGKTPYQWASEAGAANTLALLKKAGAHVQDAPLKPKSWSVQKKLTSAQKWALAAPALNTWRDLESCEILGGKPDGIEKRPAFFTLINFWNVHNKADAIECLDWLKTTGQRGTFTDALQALHGHGKGASFSPQEAPIIRKEEARHPSKGHLLAWDYCRLIHVASLAYHVGYLTEAEAWGYINDAAAKLQAAYPSWKEMSDDYILGRAVWSRKPQDEITYLQTRLLDPKELASPWKLAWDTPLGLGDWAPK